eukprot:Gb_03320 [translate_table: standard]
MRKDAWKIPWKLKVFCSFMTHPCRMWHNCLGEGAIMLVGKLVFYAKWSKFFFALSKGLRLIIKLRASTCLLLVVIHVWSMEVMARAKSQPMLCMLTSSIENVYAVNRHDGCLSCLVVGFSSCLLQLPVWREVQCVQQLYSLTSPH